MAMTSTTPAPAEPQEDKGDSPAEGRRVFSAPQPLPGVMDFIGAHVGGELAEELWR